MNDTPLLLTPGPLTTRIETRRAMLRDWGSRDPGFIALTAELRRGLLELAAGEGTHVAVPLQGSGTFIVEAALATLLHPDSRLLVLCNGAYGERMVSIARRLGRDVAALRWPEHRAVEPEAVRDALAADPAITHVALVHCETTTGLLNPLEAVAAAVAKAGRVLILDAMSSFGALPINLRQTQVGAVLASSNKCLEGVPGIGFALVAQALLEAAENNGPSTSLDLHAQWRGFERDGQWRFTPPVQVAAALVEALRLLRAEGGPPARLRRYRANLATLLSGMRRLGFTPFLDDALQAPIIATFHLPGDGSLPFRPFYDALAERGFLIYPGKLTEAETFRIGCIGDVTPVDMERLVEAVAAVLPARVADVAAPDGTPA